MRVVKKIKDINILSFEKTPKKSISIDPYFQENILSSLPKETSTNNLHQVDQTLDLNKLKAQVVENERTRPKTATEIFRERNVPVMNIETQIADAAKKAQRKNCISPNKNDGQLQGLFTLIPIISSAITGKGCKWD